MNATLYGYREISFENKEGVQIDGVSLFVGFTSDGVEGEETAKYFLKPNMIPKDGFLVGDKLILVFNPRGKLTAVTVVRE